MQFLGLQQVFILCDMNVLLNLATNWNELSKAQASKVSYTVHCAQRSIVNVPDQETSVMAATYLKISKILLSSNTYKAQQIAQKELRLSVYKPFVESLLSNIDLQEFPDTFKFKATLYGPSVRLRNLSIEEFSFADALYFRFKLTNETKYLDLLCSVLYREAAEQPLETDIRQPYHRLNAESNFELFQKLDLKDKIIVAFAFEGSRNHMAEQFPHVFPKAPKQPKDKKSIPKYTPFGELIAAKINWDPAKLESTNKMNVYSFFSIYENELRYLKKNRTKKQ